MSTQLSTNVEKMLSSLEKTVQLASQYGSEDLHNVNVFTSMAKTICDLELRNQKVMKALDACKDQNTVADFERVYETTLNSGSGRGKKSSKYSEFENTAKQLLASTSARRSQPGTIQDGDVIFENFVSDVDPITKKVMVHPVKNKKCGHYYEKSSILEVISINRQLRCPVAGCANKNPIIPANLVEDPAFAKLLKERQSTQEDSD